MYSKLTDFVKACPVERYQSLGDGPRLVAFSSLIKGQIVRLDNLEDELTIGSNCDSDFVLKGASMADCHVTLCLMQEGWHVAVVDAGAKLWVNGEPVTYAYIEHNDRLTIGRHSFIFFES